MKKSIIYALVFIPMFLLFAKTSFAQQDVAKPALTQEDYLKKSKRQKTAAWIFTGAGVAVTLLSLGDAVASGPNYTPEEEGNDGTVTSLIGVASIATGVYLFYCISKE